MLFWQNHNPSVDNQQSNSNWNFRLLGRYMLPKEVAFSANLRMQSGWPWAPIYTVNIPGSGNQSVFLEDIDNNYSEMVTLVDIRLEKAFTFGGRYKVVGLFDVYNLFNSNAETNFFLRYGEDVQQHHRRSRSARDQDRRSLPVLSVISRF